MQTLLLVCIQPRSPSLQCLACWRLSTALRRQLVWWRFSPQQSPRVTPTHGLEVLQWPFSSMCWPGLVGHACACISCWRKWPGCKLCPYWSIKPWWRWHVYIYTELFFSVSSRQNGFDKCLAGSRTFVRLDLGTHSLWQTSWSDQDLCWLLPLSSCDSASGGSFVGLSGLFPLRSLSSNLHGLCRCCAAQYDNLGDAGRCRGDPADHTHEFLGLLLTGWVCYVCLH